MSSPFGDELIRLLAARQLSQASLARRLEVSPSLISLVRHGRRTPPADQLPAWARALGLDPRSEAGQHFIDLGTIAHLPPASRARLERVLAERDRLAQRVAELEDRYRTGDPA